MVGFPFNPLNVFRFLAGDQKTELRRFSKSPPHGVGTSTAPSLSLGFHFGWAYGVDLDEHQATTSLVNNQLAHGPPFGGKSDYTQWLGMPTEPQSKPV